MISDDPAEQHIKHTRSAGHHAPVLQEADRIVITAAEVYRRRRIIKDYQIAARRSITRTKIF